VVEPRTTAEIVRDLLAIAKEHSWEQGAIYLGGDEHADGCPECKAQRYEDEEDSHRPGCKRGALFAEAEAYLRVEQTIEDERESEEQKR